MNDITRTSKEKLPDWLRRWYCLKGEPRFREAADEIERLEAELEQANDIRSDREILIELIRGALGVSIEPHQTLSERLVEAAGKSNVDWCCPHYKPRGKGCTECLAPEPPAVRKFTGVGHLEETGYIPAGSAEERERPSQPPGDGWIAVTDRLPAWTDNYSDHVYVYSATHDWGGTQFAVMRQADFYHQDDTDDIGTADSKVVTHWKPCVAPALTKAGE